MSNFGNAHNVTAYNAGDKPFDGQRFAKVLYKERLVAGVKVKPQNVAVSVPLIHTEEITSRTHQLLGAIRNMLQDAQDKIVRERVVAGATLINGAAIYWDICIAYLNEEATGNRLTKEVISAWFADSCADNLSVAFANKLGVGVEPTEEEAATVAKIVKGYEEKFAMLAGGKTSFTVEVADKLLRALEVAQITEDELGSKFVARLVKMKEAPQQDTSLLGL